MWKGSFLRWAAGAILLTGAVGAAFLIGAVAEARGDLYRRAAVRMSLAFGRTDAIEGDRSDSAIRTVPTTFHTLRVERIQLLPFQEPFVMDEFHGQLLFATHSGTLGVVDRLTGPASSIEIFDTRVPMETDALRKSDDIWSNPLFMRAWFRTHDLYVESVANGEGLLYASHHRFNGGCFVLAVNRTRIYLDDAGRVRLDDEWEEVFASEPCVSPKTSGDYFAGLQAGGRIVSPAPGTLLLSTGDHQLDGVHGTPAAPMDPDLHYGKILEIDTRTLEQQTFAVGLRNPQGLAVGSDGTIWETEHGPEGGDELNRIQRGENYGWPHVTYGMLYGFPVRDWPLAEEQGRHEGFAEPLLAFVPSIAISNLVEATAEEFPRWAGDLLIGSLKAQTLFRVRIAGDRVAYSEPIELPEGFTGRMRDLLTLDDGRLAIATDGGVLLLLGNADSPDPAARDLRVVTGYDRARESMSPAAGAVTASPADRGRVVFEQSCAPCHALTDVGGAGPGLAGVVGRAVGSTDFAYSTSMRGAGGTWTTERLLAFLSDPDQEFPGTSMERVYLVPGQYRAVVSYLEQVR